MHGRIAPSNEEARSLRGAGVAGAVRVRPAVRRAAAAAAGAVRDRDQLARQLLSGEIRDGDTVRVDLDAAADRLTVTRG